jgi:alcohol dehydrogenase
MKAAQINEYGDTSVIHINEVPKPTAASGQVLVEVHASSLNPVDTIIRAGYMKDMMALNFPATLGGDIAGTIVEVGEGVTAFQPGDKVYGQAMTIAGNSGALAEYAATAAGQVAKSPEGLDYKQAASLPLAGISALQALTEHMHVQPGQKVFIHGGAGGIGTIAIQIAKHLGAYVATTATGDNMALVKQLGADEVIDYKAQDYAEVLRDYDGVLDNVGGADINKTLEILKSGGVAVTLAGQADEAKASERGVTTLMQRTNVTTTALDELRRLVESGVVTPQVDQVFPLEHIKEAFEARENASVKGKVVIEIQ